ncbi:hypothetical protein DFQ26_009827, partial [Actinomortierella ambigua]
MPLYLSPIISQDAITQCHAFPNPHPQPIYTQLGQNPVASPHTPLNASPVLLQGRRMAVGIEVAAVAAAAAAASVSASGQTVVSPTSASSPTTPTTGSFQYRLPQLLPALTPGSSPSPPSMSPLAATSTVSPVSASTLSSRPRALLSSNANGSMTLPRSTRLSSQRRPSPAQTSLQAVLQHDTQRHPRPSQPSALVQFPVPPSPISVQTQAGSSATSQQPIVVVAPQYTSGFQPTHQRSQTSNGVVSAGSGHHDFSRHSQQQGHGVVGAVYGFSQPPAQDSVPLMYQQQLPQQPQPQPHHLQPTYRSGHIYGSQQHTYAMMEHTPHASPASIHDTPSPVVTPVVSRLASPLTSPVSSLGASYPVVPKPSWSTQQSSMNTNPTFYVNKPLFMECLAKKWSFCKLSEFFQSLDETAGIGLRLKCSLLKNTALKEEEQLRRASPLPGGNSSITKPDAQSHPRETVVTSSTRRDQQLLRTQAEVATSTPPGQFTALSEDDSMMDMDMDQSRTQSNRGTQEPTPSSDRTSSRSSVQGNNVSLPAAETHLQRQSSPSIMEEDTIMTEEAPKSESKRVNADSVRSTASSPRRTEGDRHPILEPPHSLASGGSPTFHARGPSSAPPNRGRTMDAMGVSRESIHAREYSSMRLDTQTLHSASASQYHPTAAAATATATSTSPSTTAATAATAAATAMAATPAIGGAGSTPRGPSVSAPIIIVAPDESAFEVSAKAESDTHARGSHAGPRQENGVIHVSQARSVGVGRQASIHPLDSYAYPHTSMHPFSLEPETTSTMSQACAALQAKTESPAEHGWREPPQVVAGNEQHPQHQHQHQHQHHQQRGHSQHSRAQTSDAVLSNTLARTAMASNALSTLSLCDSRSGTMDDESVSIAGTTTATTMSPMITTAATLGVASGRRFLSHEPPSMSRSLCIESSSGRGRCGEEEAGGGNNHSSLFGTGRSMRRHHHGTVHGMSSNTESGGTSSRVTTPSKRKNSLGVTTLQQQQQHSAYDGPSASSSSSVSVSRCSNLFSTFSLTSTTTSPGGTLSTTGFGSSPSPSSSPSPPSSSASPTAMCRTATPQGHDGGNRSIGAGAGGAHFFLTSHSTTQSLPGTRRTSTCTSTTDEDLKRVRCSRPGSISDSDSAESLAAHANTPGGTIRQSSTSAT